MKVKNVVEEAVRRWNEYPEGKKHSLFSGKTVCEIEEFYATKYEPIWNKERESLPSDCTKTLEEDLRIAVSRAQSWEKTHWVSIPLFLGGITYVFLSALESILLKGGFTRDALPFLAVAFIIAATGLRCNLYMRRVIYIYMYHGWILEALLRRATLSFDRAFRKKLRVGWAPWPFRQNLTAFVSLIYYVVMTLTALAIIYLVVRAIYWVIV